MCVSSTFSSKSSSQIFHGGFLDFGAQQSVISRPQVLAYCHAKRSRILPMKVLKMFRFGDDVFRSVGKLLARIATPHQSFHSILYGWFRAL